MKLLYFSSDPIGIPCLEALAAGTVEGVALAGVVSAPDRRQGRGKKLHRNPVAAAGDRLGLPVFQPERLCAEDLESFAGFDGALVFAFGRILPGSVLDLRPGRFLNLHPSPLPLLRGPSPLETALAEGWESTDICLMRVSRRMDAGPVAGRIHLAIDDLDERESLRERAARRCVELMGVLPAALNDAVQWQEQNDAEATFSRIIRKEDGRIDFSLPAQRVVSRAKAFSGWPGTVVDSGGESLRVGDIDAVEGAGPPGLVLEAGDRLVVACGSAAVSIGKLQRPSRVMVPWSEFRKAATIRPGTILPYRLSVPLVRW